MNYCVSAEGVNLCIYWQLTPVEMDFLSSHTSQSLSAFQEVGGGGKGEGSEKLLAMAGSQVKSARQ